MFAIKYADGDQEDVKLDELMEITGAADDAGQPIQLRLPADPVVPDSHHNFTPQFGTVVLRHHRYCTEKSDVCVQNCQIEPWTAWTHCTRR